jgi:hypothetical protein
MPDINADLTIDISGNTASIATDYLYVNGISAGAAHIQLAKMVWGTSAEAYRVSQSTPLPVNIYSTNPSALVGISGTVNGTVTVQNTGTGSSFVYVKGSTGYQLPISGNIQGITNGLPVEIKGSVRVVQPIVVGGSGSTGATVYPIEITGGRSLSSTRDSVGVTGTVTISGGRYLNAVTDTVSVLGSDLGSKVLTKLYDSSGATLNSTSNALNVYLTNAGFTATVSIGAVVGVTNSAALPLYVVGVTNGHPITVRGENGNAVEVTTTTPLDVNVTNDLVIDDVAIVEALTLENNPLIARLTDIKTNTAILTSIKTDITNGNLRAKISEISRPKSVASGTKTISSTTGQLESNGSLMVGVTVKAHSTNTDVIYVGGSKLVTNGTDGYPLEAGESIYIECSNLNAVYARSASGSQKLSYIGS